MTPPDAFQMLQYAVSAVAGPACEIYAVIGE